MPNYQSIQTLLVSSQTAEALEQLQDQVSTSWQQSVLLLRANLSQLEKEVMNGMISSEEAQRRRNQINAGALQLLDKMESGTATPEALFLELKSNFWNPKIAKEMANQKQNNTNISSSNINIEGSSDVIIGSGNTVTKKIFKALGRWQFWTILVVLVGLGAFMFLGGQEIIGQQDTNYASLNLIQDQLKAMAAEKGEDFLQQQLPQFEEQLKKGMKALKKEDYPNAIEELKELARKTKLASVYKNLGYAYEQNGQIEEAYKAFYKAWDTDPSPKLAASIKGRYVNLLASENGGDVAITSDPKMEKLSNYSLGQNSALKDSWAVFNFNEEYPAIIDKVDFYIPASHDWNPLHYELQVSSQSANGPFTSIGVFEPLNAYVKKSPFQEFSFSPVEAKFLKIILGPNKTTHPYSRYYEMRVWGRLQ